MATIGIFDSGLGGLSVLRAVARVLPDEKYLYYADSAYCPYGDKTPEFIVGRCKSITELLLEQGAEVVVVACNTATGAAISVLREMFPAVRFIGMEPAVKPAALGTKSGVIGVLATAGTLKASKYLKTKESYEDNCTICEHVGKGFVELVESGETSGSRAEATVSESLLPLLKKGADTIVLGCTHYPFLEDVMHRIAGDGIRFIDPAPAVARHLVHVMDEQGIPHSPAKEKGSRARPSVVLMSSGDPEALESMFDRIYPKR